jgi:putative hydrolase of the HAD superfamily
MRIEALLFDLGRVIIDLDGGRAGARWEELTGLPAGHLDPELPKRVGASSAYLAHERGEISDAAFFSYLRKEIGVPLSDAELLEGWNAIFVGEMPGIRALLAEAQKRYPLYIFSNTNAAHAEHFLLHFAEVLAPFRKIYASHELGLRKPDAAAYRAVCMDMGHPPERILFFDDRADNVDGARACGLEAVQVGSVRDIEIALAGLG